jgi:protein KRI1
VEDKLGSSLKRKRNESDLSDESTSESESEDEGELATAALDSEIMATINAIRSKDPRVYDTDAKFYTSIPQDEPGPPKAKRANRDQAMNLQDYHRHQLLSGAEASDDEQKPQDAPMTYNQEQEHLKKTIVSEINAAAAQDDEDDEQDEDDGFLTAKKRTKTKQQEPILDVENADKDPDTYLSNFMVSRAWQQPIDRHLQSLESDDDEEERRADEFEEAYNMRFEDPNKSNERLMSHARDMAAKYSVRRKEENPRQKRRELERAEKEAAKQELKAEKARLKKLRIEEVQDKVRRIKKAAGMHASQLQPQDWSRFVDDDWDDAKWEEEMQRRFGDQYYADMDAESDASAEPSSKSKNPKKPKFDDDIDIKDIVPDFEDEEARTFSLSDDDLAEIEDSKPSEGRKRKKSKEDKKKEARKERRMIESLVDSQLELEVDHGLPRSKSQSTGFRYRATSPQSFGLTARDILMADDSNLNQFAGLKKLAAFRDPSKKQKDKKHLGKKARLRQWRKDTFGDETGLQEKELLPSINVLASKPVDADDEEGGVNIGDGIAGKKKRRRGKKKQKTQAV